VSRESEGAANETPNPDLCPRSTARFETTCTDSRCQTLSAPRARPPERSGALGPRERRRGGSRGAKPPGSMT